MECVEIIPQRRGHLGKGIIGRFLQRLWTSGERQQQLLKECRAGKIGRARVAHLTRMLLRVSQQRLRIRRWRWHGAFAGDKGQLCAAPRRFRPVGGHRKVFGNGFAGIDIAPVRQRLCPSAQQQVSLF